MRQRTRCIFVAWLACATLIPPKIAVQAQGGATMNAKQGEAGSKVPTDRIPSSIRIVKSPDEIKHDADHEVATDTREQKSLEIAERATKATETQARTARWQTAFALVGAVFLGWTLYETRRTANAASKSAEAMSNIERAYLYLTNETALFADAHAHPDNPLPLPNRTILYQLQNHGKTPAVLQALSVKAEIRNTAPTLHDIASLPIGQFSGTWVVGAGEKSIKPGCEFLLNDQDFDAVIAGAKKLYFYGRVGYLDIFSNPHETGFCAVYEHLTKTFMAAGQPGSQNYDK
jgi:hypothetical protein